MSANPFAVTTALLVSIYTMSAAARCNAWHAVKLFVPCIQVCSALSVMSPLEWLRTIIPVDTSSCRFDIVTCKASAISCKIVK